MVARLDLLSLLLLSICLLACTNSGAMQGSGKKGDAAGTIVSRAPAAHVEAQIKKLAPVEMRCDLSRLPPEEREALKIIVKAARYMDEIFLRQVSREGPALREALAKAGDPLYLDYFHIMVGPWDRLEENHPFINDARKPAGAEFYPQDLTKEEWSAWLKDHPEDREAFESNFTVIRRGKEGLEAIPYSRFYQEHLIPAADLLRQAARITKDPTLKAFLLSRAEGFLTDDYYQSDMDWMDLAGDIELVIGPYEVYEDNLFGYKAAFESFVCVVDHEESAKLERIGKYLDDMERSLPYPDEHKNFERGASSPIKVVNEIFTAGDTKAGIQTTAFNLPNDERVREAKGSKKVMLKNVMNAKFEKCWIPIVNTVLAKKDLDRVSFDAYFNHTLMHEVSHALGPGNIKRNGRPTTVNKELKELYSAIEECKADVLGMYTTQYLIDQGVMPEALEEVLYATYLGGMFRSIRFGIGEAHGGGVAIQMSYLLERGAFQAEPDGRFTVDDGKAREAIRDLAHDLLVIQAEGDYDGAKRMITKYRVVPPEVQAALDRLTHVPIDIRPVYPIVKEVL